ncbi:hypothetical protein ACOSQ2_025709 [Xanthoceras sorbifolium]
MQKRSTPRQHFSSRGARLRVKLAISKKPVSPENDQQNTQVLGQNLRKTGQNKIKEGDVTRKRAALQKRTVRANIPETRTASNDMESIFHLKTTTSAASINLNFPRDQIRKRGDSIRATLPNKSLHLQRKS